MLLKFITGFVASTLLLIVFEYLFLEELFTTKRFFILVFSLGGLLMTALFFLIFFRKYHRSVKEM